MGVIGVATMTSCDEEMATAPPSTLTALPTVVYTVPPSSSAPPIDGQFVNDCVEHVMFMAYTGDTEALARWTRLEQSEPALRGECEQIGSNPEQKQIVQDEINRLEAFFEAADAEGSDETP